MTLPSNFIKMAIGIAILFHLLLFTLAKSTTPQKTIHPAPPKTTYRLPTKESDPTPALNQQNIWSPLLFSFPSKMGFSHEYLMQRLETHITFPAPEQTEYFLPLSVQDLFNNFSSTKTKKLLSRPQKTRLPHPIDPDLALPPRKNNTPRIRLSPTLKPRLDLPVPLSPALNTPPEKPWEAHATITLSAYGRVEHIFLQKPIEDPARNKAVLLWIYNLRFKPAHHPTTGTLELFSPSPNSEPKK